MNRSISKVYISIIFNANRGVIFVYSSTSCWGVEEYSIKVPLLVNKWVVIYLNVNTLFTV